MVLYQATPLVRDVILHAVEKPTRETKVSGEDACYLGIREKEERRE